MNTNFSDMHFPIGIEGAITTEFDPSTGELVVGCSQEYLGIPDCLHIQLLFDAKATEQLLSSLSALQKEFGELVSLRANRGSLQ